MTPKEKAQELVNNLREEIYKGIITTGGGNYYNASKSKLERAKDCALLVVNQMILEYTGLDGYIYKDKYNQRIKYWNEIIEEIKRI